MKAKIKTQRSIKDKVKETSQKIKKRTENKGEK